MKKFYSFVAGMGMTALSLVPYGCGDKGSQEVPMQRDTVPEVDTTKYAAPTPVINDTIKQEPSTYVVSEGDYLYKIVRKEFGLTGRALDEKVLELQKNNWGRREVAERDWCYVDKKGNLRKGKDGIGDHVEEGESLDIRKN
jgi:hypothetical protein